MPVCRGAAGELFAFHPPEGLAVQALRGGDDCAFAELGVERIDGLIELLTFERLGGCAEEVELTCATGFFESEEDHAAFPIA